MKISNDALWKKMMEDLRVQLLDSYDKNFERKGFFGRRWKKRRVKNRGSLMMVSGRLRRSIRGRVIGKYTIEFSSDAPYARIHNEGGEIRVSERMKRYFWYLYMERKQPEYKWMALMKTGSKIKIPQRQFIGYYKGMDKTVERAADRMMESMAEEIARQTRKRR